MKYMRMRMSGLIKQQVLLVVLVIAVALSAGCTTRVGGSCSDGYSPAVNNPSEC